MSNHAPAKQLVLLWRRAFLSIIVILLIVTLARVDAADPSTQLQAHLAAGEFTLARRLADQAPAADRDAWLGQIAAAQRGSGMFGAALQTASAIESDDQRDVVFGELARQPLVGPTARGGAALADFDTLIALMQSTIAPDSWDTVGGPGAVAPYPGGVLVEASGLLKRIASDAASSRSLEAIRLESTERTGRGDVRQASRLRKVSLTKLERALQVRWASGQRPTESMRHLAGLQRVQYLFVYPQSRDIVIAGPAGNWRRDSEDRPVSEESGAPVLQLDDLVVLLRNAETQGGRFGCSINPVQANLEAVQSYLAESSRQPLKPHQREAWLEGLRSRLGQQEISVFGIDPRTRAAQVLVEADYRMKLIGMGLEEGTLGVPSYLDSIRVAAGESPPALDVLRWWFTLDYDAIHTTEARDAFELRGPAVKVMSENELLTSRGERVHTGKASALNQQFAHNFNKHFAELATKYPIYAELRNLFDLALVAEIIRSQGLAEQLGWRRKLWCDEEKYPVASGHAPQRVESVMNHRVLGGKHIVVGVSGGVWADAAAVVQKGALKVDEYGLLQGEVRQAQPRGDDWWWD